MLARLADVGLLPSEAVARWGAISFRNRIVHLYDAIDPDLVYATLTEGRSDLLALFDALLQALDGE